jgi:hypothetical protein
VVATGNILFDGWKNSVRPTCRVRISPMWMDIKCLLSPTATHQLSSQIKVTAAIDSQFAQKMGLRTLLVAAVWVALGEAAAIPTTTRSACPAYVTQVAQVLLLCSLLYGLDLTVSD